MTSVITPLSNQIPSVTSQRAGGFSTPTPRASRRIAATTGRVSATRFTTRIDFCRGLRYGDMTSWCTRVGESSGTPPVSSTSSR